MAGGEINNAGAMRAASTPSTVCRIWERARCSIYRRTRADEKEFQSLVGEMFVRCRDGVRFLGDLREKPLGILPTLLATGGVNNAGCAQRAAATLPVFLECHPQDISTP